MTPEHPVGSGPWEGVDVAARAVSVWNRLPTDQARGTRMDSTKLYVGNLSYSVTNDELKELFSQYGEVKQANVIEGKGFGFVEMANAESTEEAKKALNGSDFKGRALRIEEARPQKSRENKGYSRY
jgi:RNA recognition motif-containing protein